MCSITLMMLTPSAASSFSNATICPYRSLDHRGRRHRMHALDEHVLVVRPVEDPDEAGRRHLGAHSPQEIVRALLGGRRLERRDLHALRIDGSDDMPHDTALAGGVERLQHEEHASRIALDAVRVQLLLDPIELGHLGRDRRGSGVLVAGEARGRGRIDIGKAEALADSEQVGQRL